MSDVSPQVSFALGQFIAVASVLAGLLIWRSPSLAHLVSSYLGMRRTRLFSIWHPRDRLVAGVFWLRLVVFLSFCLLTACGYLLILHGVRYSGYFFGATQLDSGAARVGIEVLLSLTKRVLFLGGWATLAAVVDWVFEGVAVIAAVKEYNRAQSMEGADAMAFDGIVFRDVADLWESRRKVLHSSSADVRPILSWSEFSSVVCRYRIIASRAIGRDLEGNKVPCAKAKI